MGEDLDSFDVDVRQRKSGKNKNQQDDIGMSGDGGGHGSSKRRRRGRGGDRSEGIKVIPEEEILNEPKEKKGKVPIIKKPESDDEAGDDGDDAYYSSLEDEESSGSWLFKLIIIAIVVSLGFSLIWLNDGSASTDLDGIDADVEPLSDISDGYIQEKVDDDDDDGDRVRSDIEPNIDEANYQVYQDNQEHDQQWSQEYGSDRPEIIAEVSETIGQESSELNDERGYQEPHDEGYFGYEQTFTDKQESEGTWTNEQDVQSENREEQLTQFKEPEIENPNDQSDYNYDQQSWHYPDQVDQRFEELNQQFEPQTEQIPHEPHDHSNDEQLTQSTFQMNPEIVTADDESVTQDQYLECPEGSHWDGLSCVNPESFVPMDEFINAYEQPPEATRENIYHQEQ